MYLEKAKRIRQSDLKKINLKIEELMIRKLFLN